MKSKGWGDEERQRADVRGDQRSGEENGEWVSSDKYEEVKGVVQAT